MPDELNPLVQNWMRVKQNILRAATDAVRAADDVELVCVSKTHEMPAILPLLAAGQRVFGENRVQETARKWPKMRAAYPDLILHLIGPLQTNKVREAVELFDVIETLDRPKLADSLAAEIARSGKSPKIYVQVNTGLERQKAGVSPDDLDGFVARCRSVYQLNIAGLMCIPPVDEQASPHFAFLAQLATRNGIAELSMGMSMDYELAIQLGATHVRVGSAIFGARA